jgi:hypothetical protein
MANPEGDLFCLPLVRGPSTAGNGSRLVVLLSASHAAQEGATGLTVGRRRVRDLHVLVTRQLANGEALHVVHGDRRPPRHVSGRGRLVPGWTASTETSTGVVPRAGPAASPGALVTAHHRLLPGPDLEPAVDGECHHRETHEPPHDSRMPVRRQLRRSPFGSQCTRRVRRVSRPRERAEGEADPIRRRDRPPRGRGPLPLASRS